MWVLSGVEIELRGKLTQTSDTPREGKTCLEFSKLQIAFARADFPEPEILQVIRTIIVA